MGLNETIVLRREWTELNKILKELRSIMDVSPVLLCFRLLRFERARRTRTGLRSNIKIRDQFRNYSPSLKLGKGSTNVRVSISSSVTCRIQPLIYFQRAEFKLKVKSEFEFGAYEHRPSSRI